MGSQTRHSATLEFTSPMAGLVPYFTPEGERLWARDWNPSAVWPISGEAVEGAVFTTEHDGEVATWCLAQYEPADGILRYVVSRPSRVTMVLVEISPSAGGSIARVTYHIVALRPEGETVLRDFDHHFQSMMSEWQATIEAAIASSDGVG